MPSSLWTIGVQGMPSYKGQHGTYELQDKLGAGGNGEVWRAVGTGREVALKILKRSKKAPADAGPRFVREVTTLRRLEGVVGVLPLLDGPADQSDLSERWFVMPIAIPLKQHLGPDASLKAICEAHAQLAAALGRVHERGIAHRDIKPDNLYWFNEQWCLGDFGLADLPDAEELTQSDKKLGPAFYIAPEMLNDAADADGKRADVYSLGKTLWVMATGQTYPMPGVHDPTFAGAAISTYRNDPRSSLLDELVRRMTLLNPLQRLRAADVAHELELLAKDPTVDAPTDPEASLKRLRAALIPHFTQQEEAARRSAMAEVAISAINDAVEDIVKAIQQQTGLKAEGWYDLPEVWGVRSYLGGPQITTEGSSGYAFEAGANGRTWRLGIGLKHQLLSDGMLVLHVGYHFDRLVNGHNANTLGMPRGWEHRGQAPNGMPSAAELAARAIAGLKQNMPDVMNRYAELIAQ